MTDQEGLLKAIYANPREDTPRLALADWLDEQAGMETCPTCGGRTGFNRCLRCDGTGRIPTYHAARAAFIRDCPPLLYKRVQYAKWEWRYDRFGDGNFTSCGMPQQFRDEAMLRVSADGMRRWAACTIRRGFVDSVTLHPDVWLHPRYGYRIRGTFPLTEVVFTARVQYVVSSTWRPGLPFMAKLVDAYEGLRVVPYGHRGTGTCPGLALCRLEWPGIDFRYAHTPMDMAVLDLDWGTHDQH